ncbi:DUF6332 family protein [Streptomyces sp. cmx-18-6]|uniref:DUF6332 family protein n=1 Tax=Streptomyces sp. cmx-18-6 TaxID=2790930 RepID=UPI00397E9649
MGRRTQAERDAMTIEIGYALISAVVLAAVTGAGILFPSLLLLDLGGTARKVVLGVAATVAVLVFVARVVHVLWRFPRQEGVLLPDAGPGPGPERPSRSGPAGVDS